MQFRPYGSTGRMVSILGISTTAFSEEREIDKYSSSIVHAFEKGVNYFDSSSFAQNGIGEKALQSVRAIALKEGLSFWYAMEVVIEAKLLPARATNALTNFHTLIKTLTDFAEDTTLEDLLIEVIDKSGLVEYHKK